jgi:hypothetical protein
MATAVVGIVGTILGVVVGSLLNFFLSAWQEKRRWKREDQSKFVQERLALYRDFLNEMEHVRLGERFERGLLERQMAVMEVLSSKEVLNRAGAAFWFADRFWGVLCGDEEPPTHVEDEEEEEFVEPPATADDIRQHFAEEHLYRFIRPVREELGVTTEFKPLVIRHKGEPLGTPEDVQEIKEREARAARPWWRRWFGRCVEAKGGGSRWGSPPPCSWTRTSPSDGPSGLLGRPLRCWWTRRARWLPI